MRQIEWIRTKDRQPESEGYYLVYTVTEGIPTLPTLAEYHKSDGFNPYWTDCHYDEFCYPDYWMPLPDPPREGELPPCKDRYPSLVKSAEYVTSSTFQPHSRTTQNVFIKCMVASQLYKEGYSYSEIGRTMGATHATVIYYVNKMKDMVSLPKAYKAEIAKYEEFKSSI